MEINSDLLEIIACPKCETELKIHSQDQMLECTDCQSHYPVRDGIPILLADPKEVMGYDQYVNTATESIEFYDDFYKNYYDYRRFARADKDFVKQILKKLEFETARPKILDLGAGTGYFGRLFEEENKNLEVYNADFSIEGFRTAQDLYDLDKIAVMDAYNVGFLPESLDAIFAMGLTPFKKDSLDEIAHLIQRITRPLKPGGFFVFIWSTNLRGSVDDISTVRSESEIKRTKYYNHTREIIRKAYQQAGGFTEIEEYVFLRPLSFLFGSLLFTQFNTKLTEIIMQIAPRSLSARLLLIGKKAQRDL